MDDVVEELDNYEIEHRPDDDPLGWHCRRWTDDLAWTDFAAEVDCPGAILVVIREAVGIVEAATIPPLPPDERFEWLESRFRLALRAVADGVVSIRERE